MAGYYVYAYLYLSQYLLYQLTLVHNEEKYNFPIRIFRLIIKAIKSAIIPIQKLIYANHYGYNNQNTNVDNSEPLNFKNLDNSDLDAVLNDAQNYSSNAKEAYNKPFKQMHPKTRYGYKNIDWSTWKSNFVNQILDDSLAIRELDNYGYGTLIYYSFNVDKTGRISDIQIKSINVSHEDKQKLAQLIQSYEYSEMTTFPANSQRQTAKVSAVMMLSNESQYSNPGDFNEFERVKFKL